MFSFKMIGDTPDQWKPAFSWQKGRAWWACLDRAAGLRFRSL